MGLFKKLLGTIESSFTIGIGASGNKTLFIDNGDANPPFLIYDDTANEWQFSEDGTTTQAMGEADVILEQGTNALTVGTIADGQILQRSGSTIIGTTDTGGSAENVIAVTAAGSGGAGNTESTATLPDGAVVTKVVANVTSALDGSATIAVIAQGSTPLTLLETTENDPATVNLYEVSEYNDIDSNSTGVVRVTLGGSPTTGSVTAYVHYVEAAS